jgi:hypothetical protein
MASDFSVAWQTIFQLLKGCLHEQLNCVAFARHQLEKNPTYCCRATSVDLKFVFRVNSPFAYKQAFT